MSAGVMMTIATAVCLVGSILWNIVAYRTDSRALKEALRKTREEDAAMGDIPYNDAIGEGRPGNSSSR